MGYLTDHMVLTFLIKNEKHVFFYFTALQKVTAIPVFLDNFTSIDNLVITNVVLMEINSC